MIFKAESSVNTSQVVPAAGGDSMSFELTRVVPRGRALARTFRLHLDHKRNPLVLISYNIIITIIISILKLIKETIRAFNYSLSSSLNTPVKELSSCWRYTPLFLCPFFCDSSSVFFSSPESSDLAFRFSLLSSFSLFPLNSRLTTDFFTT